MPGSPPPGPQPPRKRHVLRWIAGGAVALLALIIGLSVAFSGKNTDNSASSSPKTTAAPVAAAPAKAASPIVSSTSPSASPSFAQTVTFSCTGSAPDGVDITYGPSGSNYSASALPFSKTMSLDTSTLYYDTSAQLQGSGTVTCQTVVKYLDNSGNPKTATASATAQVGYNLADAEMCPGLVNDWESCS